MGESLAELHSTIISCYVTLKCGHAAMLPAALAQR
jgi:hypothetical protein